MDDGTHGGCGSGSLSAVVDLPERLVGRPALRRSLEVAGLTRRELAGPLWATPYRGVRQWKLIDEEDPDARLHAAALLLPPDGAVGGWAAARLHGAEWADGSALGGRVMPVLLVVPPHRRITPRPGIEVLRSSLRPGERVRRRGVVVTSVARTAFDLARRCERESAVALVDSLLRASGASVSDLLAYAAARPRARGAPEARMVLPLCDPGAESPMESRLRLAWHDAGRSGVRSNVEVFDRSGRFLARVDLLDQEAGVFAEYDGAVHATGERRSRDHRRQRGLEQAGLLCLRATSADVLRDRRRLLAAITATVARGLARDRSRDGWTARV